LGMQHHDDVPLSGFGFTTVKRIGRGHFSSVQLVQDASKWRYVAKCVPLPGLSARDKELANGEVDFLQELKHPRIVAYHDSFLLESANTLVILMEYCEGGDLRHAIRRKRDEGRIFCEQQIMSWFAQITLALDFIHANRVLHRDLKASNIFLQGSLLKLGDFGIARVLEGTLDNAETMVGTPFYMSPEVCKSEPYSWKSDVWGLGCVLYELCTLNHAFEAPGPLQLIHKIVNDDCEPLPEGAYSSEVTALVQQLLAKSTAQRPFIDELLAQPFVQAYACRQEEPVEPQDTPRFWDTARGMSPRRPEACPDSAQRPRPQAQTPRCPPLSCMFEELDGPSVVSLAASPEVRLVVLADRIRRRIASLTAPDGRPLTFATAFDNVDGELSVPELRSACSALDLGMSSLEATELVNSLVEDKLLEAEAEHASDAKRIMVWAHGLLAPVVNRVRVAFRTLDVEQAGSLPVDAFRAALKEQLQLNGSWEQVDVLVLLADKAENGDILYEHFVSAYGAKPLPHMPRAFICDAEPQSPPLSPRQPGWPCTPTGTYPLSETCGTFASCESTLAVTALAAPEAPF